MTDLLNAIELLGDNGLDKVSICEQLLANGEVEDETDKKLLALCIHLDGETDLDFCSYDSDCRLESGRQEYLVLTEDEREDRWNESLENYLDEGCVEGSDSPYFDREAWKDDARMDSAGISLASYDGNEGEVDDFYIYRVS